MCHRYVQGRAFNQITQKHGDSSNWKATLRQGEHIAKCADLGMNYSKTWTGRGGGSSIKNARRSLRPELPTDELAKGIWTNKIGKVAINLWRVRWKNLPTKDRLTQRGMSISGECEFCKELETTDHLLAKCEETK